MNVLKFAFLASICSLAMADWDYTSSPCTQTAWSEWNQVESYCDMIGSSQSSYVVVSGLAVANPGQTSAWSDVQNPSLIYAGARAGVGAYWCEWTQTATEAGSYSSWGPDGYGCLTVPIFGYLVFVGP
jgi:hypothetical protein